RRRDRTAQPRTRGRRRRIHARIAQGRMHQRARHPPHRSVAAMMRPFRFSVQGYSATSAADFRNQVRTAEALGYSAFHLADHYLGPGPALEAAFHPPQDIAAIPAMAMAAEATSRI